MGTVVQQRVPNLELGFVLLVGQQHAPNREDEKGCFQQLCHNSSIFGECEMLFPALVAIDLTDTKRRSDRIGKEVAFRQANPRIMTHAINPQDCHKENGEFLLCLLQCFTRPEN